MLLPSFWSYLYLKGVKMKLLVTGAAGYIGRRLVFKLLKETNNELNLFVLNENEVQYSNSTRINIFEGSTIQNSSTPC